MKKPKGISKKLWIATLPDLLNMKRRNKMNAVQMLVNGKEVVKPAIEIWSIHDPSARIDRIAFHTEQEANEVCESWNKSRSPFARLTVFPIALIQK